MQIVYPFGDVVMKINGKYHNSVVGRLKYKNKLPSTYLYVKNELET